MSNITDKISYTARAIDDIQAALEERGIDMSDVALMLYGNIIRSIKTGDYGDYTDEQGFRHSPIPIWQLENIVCIDFSSIELNNNIEFHDVILSHNNSINFVQDYQKNTVTHEIQQPLNINNNVIEIHENVQLSSNDITFFDNTVLVYQDTDVIQEGE